MFATTLFASTFASDKVTKHILTFKRIFNKYKNI